MATLTDVTSRAINPEGYTVQTVLAQNSGKSDKELVIRIKNNGATTIEDFPIFPGYRGMTPFTDKSVGWVGTQAAGAEIEVDGFTDLDDFVAYVTDLRTTLEGVQIETSNVDNFSNEIIQIEKFADGSEHKAKTNLRGYRVTGSGTQAYQNSMTIPSSKFESVLSRYLMVTIGRLVPGSEMSFNFNVSVQDRAGHLSPIPTLSIS